jgi:2-hydroxychromene-2-carboxylate isomerase
MAAPIRFYLDFASPYAWLALDRIEALARERGRALEWRPMLVWAVLKAQGVPPPLDAPAKRAYLFADMVRSAAFYGVAYRHPENLPLSAHRAARLFHALAVEDVARATAFGRAVLRGFFAEGVDIADPAALARLAARQGVDAETAAAAMDGPVGRERLAATIAAAVADGVCGSPSFLVDGELFFGADRVAQIAWRLGGGSERETGGGR